MKEGKIFDHVVRIDRIPRVSERHRSYQVPPSRCFRKSVGTIAEKHLAVIRPQLRDWLDSYAPRSKRKVDPHLTLSPIEHHPVTLHPIRLRHRRGPATELRLGSPAPVFFTNNGLADGAEIEERKRLRPVREKETQIKEISASRTQRINAIHGSPLSRDVSIRSLDLHTKCSGIWSKGKLKGL